MISCVTPCGGDVHLENRTFRGILLFTYLLTAFELSLGYSSPYTSTDKTNKNIRKQDITRNTVQTIQNTVNTSTHITKTPTQFSKHPHIHPHITKQVKTTTLQDTPK